MADNLNSDIIETKYHKMLSRPLPQRPVNSSVSIPYANSTVYDNPSCDEEQRISQRRNLDSIQVTNCGDQALNRVGQTENQGETKETSTGDICLNWEMTQGSTISSTYRSNLN